MANETIFGNWLFKDYLFPIILVFALVFGVLEKTKLLGDDKKQLNAIIAIVISMILVGVLYPKQVISNMILFMAVALVVIFVFLLLYGFVAGDKDGFNMGDSVFKKILLGIIFIAVVFAVLWATGSSPEVLSLLFKQEWSEVFWTNLVFVLAIAGVLAIVLKYGKGK
jgi:membrane-associated HD superfamily phosphohydrolase